MSTIASPRDSSSPFPRRANSSQNIISPSSSARPSLDIPRSAAASPTISAPAAPGPPGTSNKRNNRTALREYYNLRRTGSPAPGPPTLEVTSPAEVPAAPPSPPPSELDQPGLDAAAFAERAARGSSLAELLGLQARVLAELRALDAERKALVYDNYSKLIVATDTIRRMRATMDPLDPVAATLDPAVARIYEQASGVRDAARRRAAEGRGAAAAATTTRARTRQLAAEVVRTPERLRALVRDGRADEASAAWVLPRRLLETWKARGLGGDDVDACIREGDAALAGEEEQTIDV